MASCVSLEVLFPTLLPWRPPGRSDEVIPMHFSYCCKAAVASRLLWQSWSIASLYSKYLVRVGCNFGCYSAIFTDDQPFLISVRHRIIFGISLNPEVKSNDAMVPISGIENGFDVEFDESEQFIYWAEYPVSSKHHSKFIAYSQLACLY